MKRLLFWLRPAYAAPEQRHEAASGDVARYYEDAWAGAEARLLAARFRIAELEAEVRALTDDCGVLPVPLHIRSRLAHLEQANATLTAKLDQATTYVRDLTEQNEVLQARLNHPSNYRREGEG